MKIGINNIAAAQNAAKQGNFTLRQATSKELQKPKETMETSAKRNNMNFQNAIGGADFDYTKEDAIQSAWNKEQGFNLFDKLNMIDNKNNSLGITKPTTDFINKLENGLLTNTVDWFSKEMDFKNLSADELKQSVDFLSSQYSVIKDHISQNLKGEEKENQLSKLQEKVDLYKNNIATAFADKVGDFFEKNGVSGERDKIHQSIITGFDKKVQQYDKYIKENPNFAKIDNAKDQWLKNDTNYMASELRKISSASPKIANSDNNSYTIDEMQAVGDMIDEIKSHGLDANSRNKTKTGSEEEIGLSLAKLALKTEAFNKNSNISDSLKTALTKSVNNFINDIIDQIDSENKEKSEQAIIPADKNGYSPLDKNAINAIINKVKTSYEKTGNASIAMKDAVVFAIKSYNKKRQDTGEIYRYRGDVFKNFHNTKEASKNTVSSLVSATYYEEKSELENLIESFNTFADKFALGTNSYMYKSEFSALV